MSESPWTVGRLRGKGEPEVIFGFQHEDGAVEVEVLRRAGGGRCLCIASGGEIAFGLVSAGANEVVAVDTNPAQLRLVELKMIAMKLGVYRSDDQRCELTSGGTRADRDHESVLGKSTCNFTRWTLFLRDSGAAIHPAFTHLAMVCEASLSSSMEDWLVAS